MLLRHRGRHQQHPKRGQHTGSACQVSCAAELLQCHGHRHKSRQQSQQTRRRSYRQESTRCCICHCSVAAGDAEAQLSQRGKAPSQCQCVSHAVHGGVAACVLGQKSLFHGAVRPLHCETAYQPPPQAARLFEGHRCVVCAQRTPPHRRQCPGCLAPWAAAALGQLAKGTAGTMVVVLIAPPDHLQVVFMVLVNVYCSHLRA